MNQNDATNRGGQTPPAPTASSSSSPPTHAKATEDGEEEYGYLCGICFSNVHPTLNPRGRLNSCQHLFCSYCIKLWAKNTNVCPTCKARFTRIYTIHPTTGEEEETKVRKKNYVAWVEESEEDEDEDGDLAFFEADANSTDDEDAILGLTTSDHASAASSSREGGAVSGLQCEVCHQFNNAARIIFCDRRECTFMAHLECLGMQERPLTFLCERCTALRDGLDPPQNAPRAESGPTPTPTPTPIPRETSNTTPRVPATPHARTVAAAQAHPPPRAAFPTARAAPPASPEPKTSATARRRARAAAPIDMGPLAPAFAEPTPAPAVPQWSHHPDGGDDKDGPVDLSRPTLRFRNHPAFAHVQEVSEEEDRNPLQNDEDLYFLAPNKHARSAAKELAQLNQARAHEADLRRAREDVKRRRLEAAMQQEQRAIYGRTNMGYRHATPAETTSFAVDAPSGSVNLTEQRRKMLEVAEADLVNPQLRAAVEERMTREWASDLVHVLRRNRGIEESRLRLDANGNPIYNAPLTSTQLAEREKALWNQAMQQARHMVRGRFDTKLREIRDQREMMVRAEVQREAAALSKLARIIAARRNAAG